MKSRKGRLISLIVILVFLVGPVAYLLITNHTSKSYFRESDSIEFHSGDLVFRRGKSFVSQLVLLRDNKSQYSHVGIVVMKDDQPYVVHAVPGEAEKDQPEYVKMETMPEFLDKDKSADFAVYSLKGQYEQTGKRVAEKAIEYFEKHIQFDSSFDLKDESKLYCTELVWRAYQYAGLNLIETYDKVNMPFYKGDFIYPSNIFLNPVFERIYPE